jgi:4-hydroxy-tetrahydrodipicolinate synthase
VKRKGDDPVLFGRVLTAMITPFASDGSVNYKEAAKLAAFLAENGSDGVVVSGTTGETPTLTEDEKLKLFETVLEAVGDRIKVIAGTGNNDTASSIRLTKKAEALGVHGAMLVVPYYNKPPQSGLYAHFSQVALNTYLPIMLYNVPGRTSANLLPDTLAKLSRDVENIVAVKEASGNLEQVAQIKALVKEGFLIYSGDDALTLPVMSVGGCGVVSVASHVAGKLISEMIKAFINGRVTEAAEINVKLLPLFKTMFITTNPIPVKTAMRLMGMNVGPFRPPLVEPSVNEIQIIKQCLIDLGVISG